MLPATLALVVRRARSHPAPVVAVALDCLVVCTLVAALAASLGLLQRQALQTAFAAAPDVETVLSAFSPYDEEDPAGQDRAVRDALAPVASLVGGAVVGVTESGTYDLAGRRGGTTFAAVSGAEQRLGLPDGRLPAAAAGPVEVAAPAGTNLAVGDELTLTNRSDDREVAAVVVGRWERPAGQERWLADLDPSALLVSPDRFVELAGAGTAARWRAVPDLTDLEAGQLQSMSAAVTGAVTELETVAEERSTSVQPETGLVDGLADRARELSTLRALLLVPAGLLVLVAGAGLLLVAAGLAEVRRDEESLLRSRGAGHRQLAGPTALETLLLCGAAGGLGPLLATLVVRIDDVRPPLSVSGWVASLGAAVACAVALTVPVAVRAVTGDRGRQLNVERQRRRTLTLLATVLMLLVGLGVLAVVELRGFGESVGTATSATALDPLLVAAPALLLLSVAAVTGLLVVPPALRLVARLLAGREVQPVLGSRFAARAPARAIPFALAVTLATGTLAFAAIERSSSASSRIDRAAYVTGADVRVTAPPAAQRAGALAERTTLASLDGVERVTAVHRDGTFLDDLAAEVVVADLAGHPEELLGDDGGDVRAAAVSRSWDDVGVPVPPGTRSLAVGVTNAGAGAIQVVLQGPDGELTALPGESGESGENPVEVDVTGVPDGTRVSAVVTGASGAPDGAPDVTLTADGEKLDVPGSSWVADGTAVAVLADSVPNTPGSVPAVLTDDLAESASLEVGDTLTVTAFGVPTGIEVASTVPSVRTVENGSGGILLDSGTALPVLLASGLTGEPTEWWLGVREGAEAGVAAAVRDRPDIASTVQTRADALDRLAVDPGTGGEALGQVLLITAAGCLLVGMLLLVSIVLLRRRERAEQARMLGVAGGDRRLLAGVLAWEYAVVAGTGLVIGLLAGAAVSAVTLTAMTLGSGGQPLQPAPRLDLPLLSLSLPPLVMLAVPLLTMVWLVRRDHPRDLRLTERTGGRR